MVNRNTPWHTAAMATFVLLHGAWHGGWCWRDMVAALRADGHEVLAPTLSGVAERAHLAAHIDLSAHIEEVAGLLSYEDVRDVVLVGHSYAGLVIAGAAARAAERVSRLIYLDAFIADAGQSLFDLLRPERRAVYESSMRDGLIPSPPPEVFGITDPERAGWTRERLTPQPLRTLIEPLEATPSLPATYIRCTEGPLVPSFEGFAARFWGDVVEIGTGHDAMITRPTDLAALVARE
jgi:pimeloyl-ACP methyl ester carboxylesterase